jgi:excisionase family DNA binding protein
MQKSCSLLVKSPIYLALIPKTVTRWAKAGKLTSIRTLGGHRRFRKSEVDDLRNNYFKSETK